jgi:P-aminobenzoate N-oxygenase AurF
MTGTLASAAGKARLADALRSLSYTVGRLSAMSERGYQNPYLAVEWPAAVDPEADWFSSPELLSLAGTTEFEQLGERARRRLSFYEAANFYSLNIHGEKSLMQGLAVRLYRKDLLDVAPYLHHFLDEENKHSIYFGGFCTRYARVYQSRQLQLTPSDEAVHRDVADLLFFARVLIFEEIVDHINKIQAKDARLHPIARFINHNHHVEESRHLAFGRRLVQALWGSCAPEWGEHTISAIRAHLAQFLALSWREYYNPDVYADAGLPDPWQLSERAWSSQAQRAQRRAASAKCLKFLTSTGLLDQEPPDVF